MVAVGGGRGRWPAGAMQELLSPCRETPPQTQKRTPTAPPTQTTQQDLIQRLLERKPTKRLGMLSGKAADVMRHRWFEGVDWAALAAKRVTPPRRPKPSDCAKRLRELVEAERRGGGAGAGGGRGGGRESAEELAEAEAVFANF